MGQEIDKLASILGEGGHQAASQVFELLNALKKGGVGSVQDDGQGFHAVSATIGGAVQEQTPNIPSH